MLETRAHDRLLTPSVTLGIWVGVIVLGLGAGAAARNFEGINGAAGLFVLLVLSAGAVGVLQQTLP